MAIDLTGLSAKELKQLANDIKVRILEAEREARQSAYVEMLAIADKHGLQFDEVIALHGGKPRKSGTKVAPKYANPEDPSQTWSGRGRKPAWVHAALEAGKSVEDLEI